MSRNSMKTVIACTLAFLAGGVLLGPTGALAARTKAAPSKLNVVSTGKPVPDGRTLFRVNLFQDEDGQTVLLQGVTAHRTDGGFVELSDTLYAASEFRDPDRPLSFAEGPHSLTVFPATGSWDGVRAGSDLGLELRSD
ncbi:MAG: hypothetical protein CMJ84_14140 [Planctomycetes bacterium]|jgi:hypothetical protein|nr:hypothetical protein [Planctomycetota bacterium]MDP6408245.1 hypothetical protein [Planctomycetota bacterium]